MSEDEKELNSEDDFQNISGSEEEGELESHSSYKVPGTSGTDIKYQFMYRKGAAFWQLL